jgi:septum formation protein
MRLLLASASPRRAELLTSAGFSFKVTPADVEESPREGESAEAYTLRVARDKARQVAARAGSAGAVVLGADTEVVADGRILGKPEDQERAAAFLRLLSGTTHDVLTAVVVVAGERELSTVVTTQVHFTAMSSGEIEWYIATGEPMGKAGAYAIQGAAARFIDRIEGSWSNVVGLPLAAVHRLLSEVQWTDPPAGRNSFISNDERVS